MKKRLLNKKKNIKIDNPLLDYERKELKDSAYIAKKLNLLNPQKRQILYQAGIFDELFFT